MHWQLTCPWAQTNGVEMWWQKPSKVLRPAFWLVLLLPSWPRSWALALGAVSGWYGGLVDDLSNWLYNVFHAIPRDLTYSGHCSCAQYQGNSGGSLHFGCITGWTGTYRLIRGEYLKHRSRDYVRAADAIGASNNRRMFVHILPNVSHVILVQFSLLTVVLHQG
jgi:ABC-type dipeptide/oligopeptide/nickel transport system permease subunit